MLATQKKLIQGTWAQVVPIADQAAAIFYQRLFEIDPSTCALFNTTDMAQQQKKLIQILSAVGTPVTASRTRTTIPSVWRCSGRWSRDLAPHGRPKPPPRGRKSTAFCPALCATLNRKRAPKRLHNYSPN
jgi:hypothetical protein